MSDASGPEPEYVEARRVLLDALDALGIHRRSVVLVGAQAIYLQVGEGDLAVAPYTTDGDLVIDPRELGDVPTLVQALRSAGFELAIRPGTWTSADVHIDLMVPSTMGGSGRRGARLGAHGNDVARKTSGLEPAVVDRATIRIAAFDSNDTRAFDIDVAGIGALLIAKLYKIEERGVDDDRRQDKDGLDVLRLLRHAPTGQLARTLEQLSAHPLAGEVTRKAREFLERLFADRGALGARMAARASAGLEDEESISLSCEVLTRRLLAAWA